MSRIAQHTKEETKENKKKCFIEIYKNNRIEKVTVSAIIKMAKINRSTFYSYYKDVYDLLEQIENEYLEKAKKIIPVLIQGIMDHNLLQNIDKLSNFHKDVHEMLLLFLIEQPNAKIIKTTKEIARDYAISKLNLKKEELSAQDKLIIEYVANAQIGMLSYWLKNADDLKLETVARTMLLANTQGPLSVLMKYNRRQMEEKDENS